ncbi:MAG: hypothetical protein IH969_01660, partial [Candidatus Krumholzibacteriota bacterium]|nr:hypothetical protein [Candidatus Krumholzibacteriota bacterium]
RNPNLVYWLMEPGTWTTDDGATHYVEWFEREAFLFTRFEGRLDALRRAHRQALLKTGILDMLGRSSIEETTSRLSRIADAIATVVLSLVRESLRGDRVPAPDELAVIAMGKLGGRELNYSSDIDLVYVCADADDETVSFHTKVARRFGEALSEVSAEGYLYRVDLRLRPDGKAGPLVNTETSMRLYYENRGRPWEFQALLKARVVAGDREVGARVLDAVGKLV